MAEKKKVAKKKRDGTKKKVKKVSEEDKILRNVFIGMGVVLLIFLGIFLSSYFMSQSSYENVKFTTEQYGDITTYKTSLPIIYNDKDAEYNFYFRTNPDLLKEVPFEGKLYAKEFMVINSTDDFFCEGYGSIGIANIAKLYEVIGTQVMSDPNATCDEEGRYTYVQLIKGDETKVVQTGPSCYDIEIKDCEVLKGTERFMLETLVQINSYLESDEE